MAGAEQANGAKSRPAGRFPTGRQLQCLNFSSGRLLLACSSHLSSDSLVALCLTALQILADLRETGTSRDQLTDDNVLLQTGQRVDLALDGSFGQDTSGLLEGSGGQEGLIGQSSLGDAEQHLLVLDQLDALFACIDALLELGVDVLHFEAVGQCAADQRTA